jgi:tagatose-6-phosphate ketose/aldose isomerase
MLIALLKNSVAVPARNGMLRGQVVLTGSGSSVYIGECLALPMQAALRLPVQAFSAGLLLTHAEACLLPGVPGLVVSFGRSGNSPESAATVDLLLKNAPACRHLVITCNREGHLATAYAPDPRVLTFTLDDRTHDRSLVMTSSFTNMWLAARVLGLLDAPRSYVRLASRLEKLGRHVLSNRATDLARLAAVGCRRAVFLGTGPRHGSARESALKILEMTAGRIVAFAESFLGLRHGPLSALDRETLVVAFLASDPVVRAFEVDVLRELKQKRLGGPKVIVGEGVPRELLSRDDLAVECPGLRALGDENAPPLDVLVGQLLGFFHSLELGLSPDNPSPAGVIQRVVQGFAIHTPRP